MTRGRQGRMVISKEGVTEIPARKVTSSAWLQGGHPFHLLDLPPPSPFHRRRLPDSFEILIPKLAPEKKTQYGTLSLSRRAVNFPFG